MSDEADRHISWKTALAKAGPIGAVCAALLLGGGYAGKRVLDAHLQLVSGLTEKLEAVGHAIQRSTAENASGRATAVTAVTAVCERCCQVRRR